MNIDEQAAALWHALDRALQMDVGRYLPSEPNDRDVEMLSAALSAAYESGFRDGLNAMRAIGRYGEPLPSSTGGEGGTDG